MIDAEAAGLVIRPLDDASAAAWDAFVDTHPDATVFHQAGWKTVIEAGFGQACPSVYVERAGEVRGVLPLVHVRSPLFGSSLVSNGFCLYGGPLAQDAEALSALDGHAVAEAERLGVGALEYRLRRPLHPDWPTRSDLYATFRKRLAADVDAQFKSVPSKRRNMVRKGIKQGLVTEIDNGIDRFYDIYAESWRNLGTPVYARRYFQAVKDVFADSCEFLVVSHQGAPIAAALCLYFRDEVMPFYLGGRASGRAVAANDFLFWEAMRRGCERECAFFDFGRSKKDTGSFFFKTDWGYAPEWLHYEYKLLGLSAIPEKNPLNQKYRLMVESWKRLPIVISNLLGPWISRQLG